MSDAGRWPPYRYLAGAGIVLLLVWGGARLLAAAAQPLFLAAIGVLLAFLLHYPIDWLARRLPRALAAFATLLFCLALAALIALWLLPTLYRQAAELAGRLPALLGRLAAWWETSRRGALADLPGGDLAATLEQAVLEELGALLSGALPLAVDALFATLAAVFVVGVGFFLAYRPRLYVGGLLRLVPPPREAQAEAFLQRLAAVIRGWLVGALVSMTTVGLLTALVTRLLGLESWLLLGFLAFALELVPYVGPIVAALPAVALALADSPAHALQTALAYLAIQQIEGNAITPIVMKRAIELPPALLLVWQVAMVSAFGLPALFVAAPLLAAAMVAVDHFWIRGALGWRERGADPR